MQQDLEPSAKRKRRDVKCEQCKLEMSKYSCPKCGFRSCSVVCVKKHKDVYQCDGMPRVWQKIEKFTHFTSDVSISDQRFFEEVQKRLKTEDPVSALTDSNVVKSEKPKQQSQIDSTSPDSILPRKEHLLLKSTNFRRIFLKIDPEHPIDGSRHESFSDTIFWTIRLRFVRSNQQNSTNALQLLSSYASPPSSEPSSASNSPTKQITEDGELDAELEDQPTCRSTSEEEFAIDVSSLPKPTELIECFSYKARDIPESVTVRTLIKQFVQPKINGPVVSRTDLDLVKMKPFLQTPDSCLVYMETIINGATKYIPVEQSKTILENLRNRTVTGHPEFIVTLNTDRFNFERPTQTDLKSIQPVFYRQYNNNNRGRPNAPHQGNRRGGFNQNKRFQRGRPYQQRGGRRF